jgi:hypothetical protein
MDIELFSSIDQVRLLCAALGCFNRLHLSPLTRLSMCIPPVSAPWPSVVGGRARYISRRRGAGWRRPDGHDSHRLLLVIIEFRAGQRHSHRSRTMITHRGALAFEGVQYFYKNDLQQWLEVDHQLSVSISASPNSKT